MSVLRDKLHALVDEIADALEARSGDDWLDQDASPLGRRRHLDLVRRNVLPAVKEGRRRLVRRRDIDAYLARKTVVKIDEKAAEEREVARVIATIGLNRRRAG